MKEFDLKSLVESRFGENYELHEKYVNRTFAKVLKTIGFDKCYKRAKGAYLYDAEGNEYLDFLSGYGVFGIGRNHPVVGKAIKDAIDMDLSNMVQLDCALLSGLMGEALAKKLGGRLDACFFCNSGTEANEGAVKFARMHTKRPRVIALTGDYHGLSYGSLSLTPSSHFQDGYGPFVPGFESVEWGNLDALEKELKKGDVAAFIFEPVQGHGVFIPSGEYLRGAQELCRKYGTLLIADEVQTGLCRTGKWFGFQHWGLDPDIVTVAKIMSGGYVPAAAFVTTREIHQSSFSSLENCVIHSTTYGRNNLAMVAGLATLSVLENEKLDGNAAKMGAYLAEKLAPLAKKYSYIKEIRQIGLMLAIEFKEPDGFARKLAWKGLKAANNSLFTQMVVTSMMDKHRILTQVASHSLDVVKILPPLIITEKEADRFVSAFDDVMDGAMNVTGPLWKFGTRLIAASKSNKKA